LLPAPSLGRRSFLGLAAGLLAFPIAASRGEERRYHIGFANLTEDAGTRIEGLGFTGAEVRTSFLLAARSLPVEMVFYDNDRNREKTLANADDAIARKLDLFIEYSDDAGGNADVGKRMKAAGIPVPAVIYPVPGAPLCGPPTMPWPDGWRVRRLRGSRMPPGPADPPPSLWSGISATAAIMCPSASRRSPPRSRSSCRRQRRRASTATATRLRPTRSSAASQPHKPAQAADRRARRYDRDDGESRGRERRGHA
jgi:hypothetical protein